MNEIVMELRTIIGGIKDDEWVEIVSMIEKIIGEKYPNVFVVVIENKNKDVII